MTKQNKSSHLRIFLSPSPKGLLIRQFLVAAVNGTLYLYHFDFVHFLSPDDAEVHSRHFFV